MWLWYYGDSDIEGLQLDNCDPICTDECVREAYEVDISYASLSGLQGFITQDRLDSGLEESYHQALELDHRVRSEHLTETIHTLQVSIGENTMLT